MNSQLLREKDLIKVMVLLVFNIFHIFTRQILLRLYRLHGNGKKAKVQKMQWHKSWLIQEWLPWEDAQYARIQAVLMFI